MNRSRRLWIAVAAGALILGPAALGCSTTSAPKTAKIQAGDMPDGADWTGVYYNELYGHLHIIQEGDKVDGKWQRPQREKWGELHGTATGNVLRFDWIEYKTGVVGPNSQSSGKGYFKYTRPEGENVDDRIDGEIGDGKDEVGTGWDAIKQRNVKPDLASIGGTGTGDLGGGDWDQENKEEGTPEPPAPPSGE
ncbi:hypothetical protein [Chondromyces crocatus]|uniref:Lipoprotein n=1 Tax=Chondromyces crocatus TaxID=52 RepID=A0A0K1E887_CHOCO|nr:hypothetical protein [Chondromyces crocatus]AKT37065.1 uncharacterized protein CMC5_011910 [Chondromyces crocatus]